MPATEPGSTRTTDPVPARRQRPAWWWRGSVTRPAWGSTLATIVIVGVVAPLLLATAWAVAALLGRHTDTQQAEQPVVVAVQAGTTRREYPVTVLSSPVPDLRVLAPGGGVVTDSQVAVGAAFGPGDRVLALDGAAYLAFTGATPLWRPVTAGTGGADVRELQQFLTDLHLYSGPLSGTADGPTMAAVRGFVVGHGLGDGSTLPVDRLVYTGPARSPVTKVGAVTGQRVSPGTDLFDVQSAVPGLRVAPVGQDWPAGPHGTYTLTVGGVNVPFDPTRRAVGNPKDAVLVSRVLANAASIGGTVSEDTPSPVGIAPASAVVVQADGGMCVFPRRRGAGQPGGPGGGIAVDGEPAAVVGGAPDPGEPAGHQAGPDVHLTLEGVTFRYPGTGRPVLDAVDLSIEAGGVTAVVGPSGSGKTTLLAVLGGLLTPDAGRVALRRPGGEPSPPGPDVSWVLQTVNVLPDRTALENVSLGAHARGLGVDASLTEAGVRLDQVGLGERARTPARLLSGGEVQRVVIARALASHRPIVLADEPTGQLDRATTATVMDSLVRTAADRCVVVVTHDPEVAGRCRRVLRLQDGRLHEAADAGGHR